MDEIEAVPSYVAEGEHSTAQEGESASRLGSSVAPSRGRGRGGRGRGVRGRIARGRERRVSQLCADRAPGVRQTANGNNGNYGVGNATASKNNRSISKVLQRATECWKLDKIGFQEVIIEKDFVPRAVDNRAEAYVRCVVERLRVEMNSLSGMLPTGRAAFAIMFLRPLIQKQVLWVNQRIRLENVSNLHVTEGDIVKFLAILFASHLTNLSLDSITKLVKELGHDCLGMEMVNFLSGNVCAFHPSMTHVSSASSWEARRDPTKFLTDFEFTAFDTSRRLFYVPTCQMLTLDDELMGTRSNSNPVKTLSSRKADREGHSSDVLADALFRITLMSRFHRRGEQQVDTVERLIRSVQECQGEMSCRSAILTADRGYGRERFLRVIQEKGLSLLFVMPDHVLSIHPFNALSRLDCTREDLIHYQEEESETIPADDTAGIIDEDATRVQNNTECDTIQRLSVEDIGGVTNMADFIIDDDPLYGMACFSAKRRGSQRNASERAVAIREPTRQPVANIIRFRYDLPASLSTQVMCWVASTMPIGTKRNLYSDEKLVGDEQTWNPRIIEFLDVQCTPLTIGQRCADWFLLRRFRLTATIAAKLLQHDSTFRESLQLRRTDGVTKDAKAWMKELMTSWFSNRRGTEAMMRGTINENCVLSALEGMPWVKAIREVGLLSRREETYWAASPDAVAVLDLLQVRGAEGWTSRDIILHDETRVSVATVEIKTRVADTTVNDGSSHVSVTPYVGAWNSAQILRVVPSDHLGQILHQCYVLGVNVAVYACASETGLLYTAIIHVPNSAIAIARSAYGSIIDCLRWAHTQQWTVPRFCSDNEKRTIMSQRSLWIPVNGHVLSKGPLPPVKVFRHGLQVLYSKTKGGVDGVTQYRSIMRSSTTTMGWEQKLVTQTLKTLLINSFIAWRLVETCGTDNGYEFKSLHAFRSKLNSLESFADYVWAVSRELLGYGDLLQTQSGARSNFTNVTGADGGPKTPETKRLCLEAMRHKRKREVFFNSTEGKRLRLELHSHAPRLQATPKWCALCGALRGRYAGRRSSTQCTLCTVHLCVRPIQKGASSCWVLWHTEKSVSKDSIIAVIGDPHEANPGGHNNEVLNNALDSSEDEPLEVNTHD